MITSEKNALGKCSEFKAWTKAWTSFNESSIPYQLSEDQYWAFMAVMWILATLDSKPFFEFMSYSTEATRNYVLCRAWGWRAQHLANFSFPSWSRAFANLQINQCSASSRTMQCLRRFCGTWWKDATYWSVFCLCEPCVQSVKWYCAV